MAKGKVNKTQLIKDAMTKNPDASPSEIAKGLSKYKINAQYVSVVKSNMKKKTGGKKVVRRKIKKKSEQSFTISELVKASKLAEELGGTARAKALLEALEKLT